MVQVEMFEEPTHIVVVLDKSGSMQATKSDTIGGFNRFLEEQQKAPGEALMTLIQFDTTYTVSFERIPVRSVKPLTDSSYTPYGYTALLDSAHRAIQAAHQAKKVVVVMITDGEENSSKEIKKEQLKKLIEDKQQAGWMFVYLGTHANAFAEGASYGVYTSNTVRTHGISESFLGASTATASYRSTSSNVADFSFLDADKGKASTNGTTSG